MDQEAFQAVLRSLTSTCLFHARAYSSDTVLIELLFFDQELDESFFIRRFPREFDAVEVHHFWIFEQFARTLKVPIFRRLVLFSIDRLENVLDGFVCSFTSFKAVFGPIPRMVSV